MKEMRVRLVLAFPKALWPVLASYILPTRIFAIKLENCLANINKKCSNHF